MFGIACCGPLNVAPSVECEDEASESLGMSRKGKRQRSPRKTSQLRLVNGELLVPVPKRPKDMDDEHLERALTFAQRRVEELREGIKRRADARVEVPLTRCTPEE